MLSTKARTAVNTWLGAGADIIKVSIQADVYKHGAGDWTSATHFANVPRGASEFTMQNGCRDNCIVKAIQNYTSILRTKKPFFFPSPNWAINEPSPIAFLVHLVGDIHQPLHISFADDKGGNKVTVKWFGQPSNLHAVWDDGIISRFGKDYNKLAKELTDEINKNPAIMTKYSKSTDPVQWARESFQITKNVYKNLPNNLSSQNQAYVDNNKQTIREQLMAGGIRLAKLLNQIFG
jgi:hypothetical protein